jgi:3-phosphoshikimate 1-carboxyvinyltransferase
MKTINPFHFHHVIHANASKSDAQRCLILAAFSEQPVQISGMDDSEDIQSMIRCIETLGARYDKITDTVYPISERNKISITLNVGESGFALRTLALVGLALTKNLTLTGSGTLLNRNQHQLCHVLEKLGLQVLSKNEKLPLNIFGSIARKSILVNGKDGSQVISGLLLLAPLLKQESIIAIENPTSKPYLDMTISRMRDFGLSIQDIEENKYKIPGNQKIQLNQIQLEGDWSGAANHLVGAAISGQVELHGLQKNSKQADRAILKILEEFGAEITWKEDILLVRGSQSKNPFQTNILDCPDLFPIIVVLACSAIGISRISGIHRLKNKESNRLNVMCELLDKWKVRYQIEENNIRIVGTGSLVGAEINTYEDHRIAMAGTIAACISGKEMILNNDACIKKSYPNFFMDLGI